MAKPKVSGSIDTDKNKAVWTEVASVPIKRGVVDGGRCPLMFTQHVGDGELPNGRKFTVMLGIGSGSLIVSVEATDDDKSRTYAVSPREMIEAIVAAEFPA